MRRPSSRPVPGVAPAIRRRQGLGPAEIAAAIARQGGLCLLCRRPLGVSFAVDHDHALGARHGHDPDRGCPRCFRGILDNDCNLVLGYAKDDPALLERAAAYVRLARRHR